jgi:hypothetical protein
VPRLCAGQQGRIVRCAEVGQDGTTWADCGLASTPAQWTDVVAILPRLLSQLRRSLAPISDCGDNAIVAIIVKPTSEQARKATDDVSLIVLNLGTDTIVCVFS